MGQRHRDHLPEDFSERSLAEDVRAGLTSSPKTLPPKWFYDKVGSELYEEITRLPEYYPFEAEREILLSHATEIVRAAGSRHLVELGSGSSEKTRALIEAVLSGTPESEHAAYRAIDVSDSALHAAADDHAAVFVARCGNVRPIGLRRRGGRRGMDARIDARDQFVLPMQALHLPDAQRAEPDERQRQRGE